MIIICIIVYYQRYLMKAREVLKILNVTRPTLSKYVKDGVIKVDSTYGGKHNYNEQSVYAFIGLKNKKHDKMNVCYARVSNPPKRYAEEQLSRLLNFCSSKGIQVDRTFIDVKSGMNFDRDGLNELIQEIVKGNIGTIVIENKDRLCRFGFELFESFCKFYNTSIVVVNDLTDKTYEEELTEDLISIIHYFSMKSYSHRRKLNKIRKELENNDKK